MPEHARGAGLIIGLFAALVAGSVFLVVVQGGMPSPASLNVQVVLAGVFTYVAGTGLYYASACAFEGRAEYASQFAKVKPVFSVLLAIVVLRETVGFWSWIALALIAVALMILMRGADRGFFSWQALFLGLLTALSWAVGEVFVKLGFRAGQPFQDALLAMLSATAVLLPVVLWVMSSAQRPSLRVDWLLPFLLHGILSFGVAYTAFFHSIVLIGLAPTILINAFWPALAMVLGCLVARLRREACDVRPSIWVAVVLLVLGSLAQIAAL